MGCTDPLRREGGSGHPISVLSELVASYLCFLLLTCTHSNDATHSFRYRILNMIPRHELRVGGCTPDEESAAFVQYSVILAAAAKPIV